MLGISLHQSFEQSLRQSFRTTFLTFLQALLRWGPKEDEANTSETASGW